PECRQDDVAELLLSKQFGTERVGLAAKMSSIISWRRAFSRRDCAARFRHRRRRETLNETGLNCVVLQAVIRPGRAAFTAVYFNQIAISAGLLGEINGKPSGKLRLLRF